jgi:hypothetical protein
LEGKWRHQQYKYAGHPTFKYSSFFAHVCLSPLDSRTGWIHGHSERYSLESLGFLKERALRRHHELQIDAKLAARIDKKP